MSQLKSFLLSQTDKYGALLEIGVSKIDWECILQILYVKLQLQFCRVPCSEKAFEDTNP